MLLKQISEYIILEQISLEVLQKNNSSLTPVENVNRHLT